MKLKIILIFFIFTIVFCEKNKILEKPKQLNKDNYITEEMCKNLPEKLIDLKIKTICKNFVKNEKKIKEEEKKELSFFKDFENIFIHDTRKNLLIENKFKNYKEIIFVKNSKWGKEENFENLLFEIPDFMIYDKPKHKDKKIESKKLYIKKLLTKKT